MVPVGERDPAHGRARPLVGFDERQTATLVSGKPLIYEDELYSEEHKRKVTTGKVDCKVMRALKNKATKSVLAIDRQPIGEWIREPFDKLKQTIRRPIQLQQKSRGMKL